MRKHLLLLLLFISSVSLQAEKLYWVGGSGNFNDPAHWATKSGGNGGAKSPGANDDVIFDKNSFKSESRVNLHSLTEVHSFIVTDEANKMVVEGGASSSLRISGDFKLEGGINWQYLGKIYFTTQTNAEINFGFVFPKGDVVFDGAGEWKMSSNIITEDPAGVVFVNGKIIMSSYAISSSSIIHSGNKFVINADGGFINAKEFAVLKEKFLIEGSGLDLFTDVTNKNTSIEAGVQAMLNSRITHSSPADVMAVGSSNIDSVTCFGSTDGSVSINWSGGPACSNYQITFNPTFANAPYPATSSPFLCTGIGAGPYLVRVFCLTTGTYVPSSASVTIPSPTKLDILWDLTTSPGCNGICDGVISYGIAGGNSFYSVDWLSIGTHTYLTGSDQDTVRNLCAGTFTVTVVDSYGCDTTKTIDLNEPTVIIPNPGSTDQLCFGEANGTVFVAPTGGTPFGANQSSGIPYTVVWNSNMALNNDTLYNLMPNTYNYVITDANSCTSTGSIVVDSITKITFTPGTPVAVSCADVCDGTANVTTVAGGTGPGTYTFSWAGPGSPSIVNTANSSSASGMCAGTYTLTITDANGCDTTHTFTILSPTLLVGNVATTNVSCAGGNNGSATGTRTGGNGPTFTFSWFNATTNPVAGGIPFTTGVTASNLTAGNYTMVVVDVNGCNDTVPFVINEPLPLVVGLTPTNPTCFGFTNGQICVSTSGGTGVATYTLSPVAGTFAAGCYNNLPAGTYTVNATDANLCPASSSVTLISFPQIFPNLTHNDPNCNASCDGTATSVPTGGSGGGYSFSWSCNPLANSGTLTGACAGSCTLTVTDGNSCPQTASVTFVDPNPLTLTVNNTNLLCFNATTAQITTVVNGGTPGYNYTWMPGTIHTPGLSNVGAGTYTLTLTDAHGCTKIDSATVTSPLPITINTTPTNPTCFGSCNGAITTMLSGGTAPYTQLWLPTNSTALNQSNLCAGTYDISVTDANNCVQTQSVVLTAPSPVVVTTDTTVTLCINACNGTATATASGGNGGYTYLWSCGAQTTQTAIGLCDGICNVTVTDVMGCTGVASATITEPTAVTTSVGSITPSCSNICNGTANINPSGGTPPYTHTLDTNPVGTSLTGLCVGTHTVVTTDANGCTATTTFTVPVQVTLSVTTSPGLLTCNGDCNGIATANVTGANGSVNFLWTPTGQITATATGLCAGVHTVLVTDAIGCTVSATATFTDPPVLTAPVTVVPVDCNGNCTGSASVAPAGGVAPYTVTWSNGGTGNSINSLCIGSYTATITDANGCSITQIANIIEPTSFTIALTGTSPTVCAGTDGSITAAVGGGSGSYNYNWMPGSVTTATISGIGAGIYTVTITDATFGCDTILTFGLSDPNSPVTTSTVTPATCPGQANGIATVDGTSTAGAVTVTFPGGLSGPGPLTNNALAAGTYAVEVTDATNCIAFENIVITQPAPFVDNEVLTNLACNGVSTGSIVLSPTGGTRPYTYMLNGLAEADSSMTGLAAGTHTLIVTDANGCMYTFNYTLTQPNALTAVESHSNLNCTTGFGSASVAVSGGTASYTYSWNTTPVQSTTSIANVPSGSYTVVVTDANGCTAQDTFSIHANPVIAAGFVSTDNLCATGCSGTASFTPTGGTGVYTYAWSTGQTTQSITGICPGTTYTASVSDNNGCSSVVSYTVNAPTPLLNSNTAVAPTCNGGCNGSVTANASGGTPPYTYSWNPNVSNTQTALNLCAGTYTVSITDANGCNVSTISTLADPPTFLANITPHQPTCFGDCNGMLVSAPIGGTAPYTFAWGPAPTSGSNDTLSGLCIGSYSVIVTDANGCSNTGNITLTQPPHVGLAASSSPATCGLVPCDGAITINSIIGISVNWLSPPVACPSCLANADLCAGIYDIEVTDAVGCKDTVPVGVSTASGPLVNVDSTNVSCNGGSDGIATVVSVTGTGPYNYSWGVPITDLDSIASNLPAGNYLSQVADGSGCITITPITVNEPNVINDNETITDATCNGVSTGNIMLNPSGGTPPYTYAWSNGPVTQNNMGVAPGSYTVDITDANSCTYSFEYTVGADLNILYQLTTTNTSCFGQCTGTATLNNINGGIAPYTFAWSDGQAGTFANGLCAGTYSVTITDNVGCFITVDTTITGPTQVAVNPTVTNTACGVCAGSAALAPAGGNGTYTYLWSNGQTTSTATGLCAGVYMVDVTDGAGCVSQHNIAVNNTNGPSLTTSSTNVTCAGQCNGTASVTPTGGTAPYQYNWISGGQLTSSVSGLCAGTYYVQVKDGANCIINDTVDITETTTIVANAAITPTTCGASTGAVTVTPGGGVIPYTYIWSNGLPATNSQSNLAAGSYSVEITDAGGCKDTTFITINSNNGPIVTVAVDSVSCNSAADGSATLTVTGGVTPYTITWSSGSDADAFTNDSLQAGVYTATVEDAAGCISVKIFTIKEPNQLALSISNTQLPNCAAACNGAITAIPSGGSLSYSYAWSNGASTSTISNLCAGMYSVTVTDSKGCTATQFAPLNNNPTPFTISEVNVNATCGLCDGSSALTVTGGQAPFTYNWSNGSATSSASALCAGIYMVDITDNMGCFQQHNVSISNTNGPTVNVVSTDVTCGGQLTGTATVSASGGLPPYQYNWLPGGQTSTTVSNLAAGTYFVQVKDANNCVTNDTAIISELNVLAANPSVTSATCGVCDGSVSLNTSGGSIPYTYVWSNGLPAIPTQSGLCAGTYTVEITDNNGCKDTSFVSINSTNTPIVSINTDSVRCNGDDNGQAILTISGGVSPYGIVWSSGADLDAFTNDSLSAGVYAVTITDAANCVSAQTFTIEEPNPLALSLSSTQLPNCAAACNGAITAIPSGGSLSYSYSWSNAGTTSTISGLCSGLYSVTVLDPKGCTATQFTQLNNNPSPFTISEVSVNATCGMCDGSSALTVTGGQAPFTYNWSNGNTTSSSSALCAGIYMVDITDNMGCLQQHNISISNTNGPTVNVVSTNVNCGGQLTGTATVSASGGIPPYQYNWLPGGQTSTTVSGLGAGTYFVQVKDANNCVTNDTAIISELNVLAANPSVIAANCGVCDGSVSLNTNGGSIPYTYVWSNGLPATPTQSGLCAGTYSVEITDNNGCKDTSFVSVNSTNAPVVSISTDSVLCNGDANGQAVISIGGGVSPYGIVWSSGSDLNTTTNDSLSAGTYAVTVTDAANCVSAQTFTIEEATQLGLSLSNTQLPNCAAICNGALTAIPSGGSLNYTYMWVPGAFTTDVISNLCAGAYTLTVTDSKGCKASQTSVLNDNPTPFTITSAVTSPACGLCDGVIDITLTGGSAPFTYVWSNGDTSEDIDSVCAGVYDVAITDNAGCSQTTTFPISNSNGITGETITSTNETCFGTCDGTATVVPVGGTPGYTYQWLHNGATTNSQTNMCAGTYFLQISDTNNCIRTSQVDILSPSQMLVVPSLTSPTCGASDGTITLNVSGGTGALSYTWNPAVAGNTNTATGLTAGVYTITVTDAAGTPCSQSFTVTLSNSNGPLVTVTETNVTCHGACDGSVALAITSPNSPTVLWNTGSTANSLNGLCPGNYTAVITDNITLCVTSISATIIEPDTILFSIANTVDLVCNGTCTGSINSVPSGGVLPYTFSWSPTAGTTPDLNNLCANTYTVTVTDANGCVNTQSTTLTEPTAITINGVVTNTSCSSVAIGAIDLTVGGGTPGYTYQWSGGSTATTADISSLLFGQYTITVTDTNLCTKIDSFAVAATDTAIANAGPDQVFCVSGDVTLDGSASVVNSGATITYSWTQVSSTTILGTVDTLVVTPSSGVTSYQLVITNSAGCSDTDTVALTANPLPVANAGSDQEIFYGQNTTIGGSPTGPTGATLSWLPNIGLSNNTIANPVSTTTLTTTYTVIVTDTATGCVSRDSMILTVLPQIVIPNGISPNGDGKNDLWIIDAIYKFPNNEVEVYNRWGELLYSKTGYDNTWDGSYKGKPLPIGTYYYVVKLNDPDYPDVYTGPITIFK